MVCCSLMYSVCPCHCCRDDNGPVAFCCHWHKKMLMDWAKEPQPPQAGEVPNFGIHDLIMTMFCSMWWRVFHPCKAIEDGMIIPVLQVGHFLVKTMDLWFWWMQAFTTTIGGWVKIYFMEWQLACHIYHIPVPSIKLKIDQRAGAVCCSWNFTDSVKFHVKISPSRLLKKSKMTLFKIVCQYNLYKWLFCKSEYCKITTHSFYKTPLQTIWTSLFLADPI